MRKPTSLYFKKGGILIMDMINLRRTILAALITTLIWGTMIPAGQAEEPTRDDYFVYQSVTLADTNQKLTGFSTSGSLAVLKKPGDNAVDYELWTQGGFYSNKDQENNKTVYGPVQFTRNSNTEAVSFKTKGFDLVEEVVNQALTQVEKNPRIEGDWDQEVSLDLLKSFLPQKLAFHMNVQKIELKTGVEALLIRTYTDVFTMEIIPTADYFNEGTFSGEYKCVLVYSPEDHIMYQMASDFTANKGKEILQIQETAFLAASDGKPAYPLLDMREVMDLRKQAKPAPPASMPLWAVQAIKAQQVVSLASATTAERASNPALLPIVAQIVELDGFAGIAGLPSSSSLIEYYGELYGGEGGKLAGRFLSTVGSEALGASGLLPETLLASTVPVIPALATAYSVYTMYEIAADLTAMAFAAELGKLTPFRWPKTSLDDEALKAFDLKEPIGETAEPGEIPEPGKSSGIGKTALWIGAGGAVAAGVALGLSGADSLSQDDDGGTSDDCEEYYDNLEATCCTTSGGVQVVAVPIPKSCGCPTGTTDVGDDNITAGGPYDLCDCNCN